MDVSKNRGTPKWMVKIMEHPIKMDDLGVPLFLETPMFFLSSIVVVLKTIDHKKTCERNITGIHRNITVDYSIIVAICDLYPYTKFEFKLV